MKIASQIIFIGTIFVLLGAMGILSYGAGFFGPAFSGDLAWEEVVLNGGGILKNGLFLLAGIFCFKKRPFSLKLMYLALLLSLLHGLILVFLISPMVIFLLIGPAIDCALLVWVWRIGPHFFKQEEELTEFYERKAARQKRNLPYLKGLTFVGLLCLLAPLSIMITWFYAAGQGSTQPESVEIFQGHFPEFLQRRYGTSYLSIAFGMASIIIAGICLRLPGKLWRGINIFVLALSGLLLFMNLFGMM
jgi:hypothetical protein